MAWSQPAPGPGTRHEPSPPAPVQSLLAVLDDLPTTDPPPPPAPSPDPTTIDTPPPPDPTQDAPPPAPSPDPTPDAPPASPPLPPPPPPPEPTPSPLPPLSPPLPPPTPPTPSSQPPAPAPLPRSALTFSTGPPPAHKSAVGIAAGSAAAAAVLLAALAVCLVVALRRRRRAARGHGHMHADAAEAAGTTPPVIGSVSLSPQQPRPSKSPAAGPRGPQHSIELTPPPPTTTASSLDSSSSAASSLAISGSGSGRPPARPLPAAAAAGEIHFRGAFTYDQLAAATNGFSDSNLVGRGGFGDVYVGMVDGGMQPVAVKRLRAGSQQGDREFQAEVRIISRVHHRNLVSLLGYCIDGGHRLLVYEFVPNMTLQYHLQAFNSTGEVEAVLDWPTRWKIAVGAAKGLVYLHEDCHPRIIHRDIKAANILLDPDFNPKVSDFGMAKFMPRDNTHIATRIVGTTGYLAPEYLSSGKLSEKSDVFSFGVVLLELITGMNAAISSSDPYTEDTLVHWARPLLTQALEFRDYDELVDPLLPGFDANKMARLVRCAAAAVSTSARSRPRMSQIVRHLVGGASAEEIDTCGVRSGDSSVVQFRPVRYNEIRTSRREARVQKLHQA